MNLIVEGRSPDCLLILESDENTTYNDLKNGCKETVIKQLKTEQNNICAYCDREMNTIRIEHFIPQSKDPNLDLSYSNFLGVCNGMFYFDRKNNKGIKYCEKTREDKNLKFNPKLKPHIDSIYFDSSGYVKSTDKVIQNDFDDILNLNFEELREERVESFNEESNNLIEFCSVFDIDKNEGIIRMLKQFKNRSHRRFLEENFNKI